jgi:hypothetical protein
VGRRELIVTISLREKHPEDVEIIEWYESIPKSERSREIRRVILKSIEKLVGTYNRQPAYNDVTAKNRTTIPNFTLEQMNVVGDNNDDADFDSLLDNLGIVGGNE